MTQREGGWLAGWLAVEQCHYAATDAEESPIVKGLSRGRSMPRKQSGQCLLARATDDGRLGRNGENSERILKCSFDKIRLKNKDEASLVQGSSKLLP